MGRRRLRLAVWVGVVIGLLAVQFIGLTVARAWPWAGVGEGLVVVMAALLWTTPADAIRLSRGVSEGVIVVGAAALQAVAGAGIGVAAVNVGVCGILLAGLRWTGRSPWWAAVVAWNPLLVLLAAGRAS